MVQTQAMWLQRLNYSPVLLMIIFHFLNWKAEWLFKIWWLFITCVVSVVVWKICILNFCPYPVNKSLLWHYPLGPLQCHQKQHRHSTDIIRSNGSPEFACFSSSNLRQKTLFRTLFFLNFLFYLTEIHLAENLDANFMCIKISEFLSKIIMGMLADPSLHQVWVGGTTVYICCHGIFVQ